jgi:hypothetical protein
MSDFQSGSIHTTLNSKKNTCVRFGVMVNYYTIGVDVGQI